MSNSVKTDNIINVLNILLNCDIHADERYFWEVSGSPFVFLYTLSVVGFCFLAVTGPFV